MTLRDVGLAGVRERVEGVSTRDSFAEPSQRRKKEWGGVL